MGCVARSCLGATRPPHQAGEDTSARQRTRNKRNTLHVVSSTRAQNLPMELLEWFWEQEFEEKGRGAKVPDLGV